MPSNFRPISISLSPNVQKDDVALAWKLLFQPWNWKRGPAVKALEETFKSYLGVKYAFSFNSGRSALYAILKAIGLPENSGVLLQAFTCNAVPNPVLWAGLHPVYVDCNKDDFNISLEDLKEKITQNSRVVIVQHTFGLPVHIEEASLIARQNSLVLIEDCAHALGAERNGRKLGTFGEAAFFSFARDKVISCVYGGMAVTNNGEIGKKLAQLQKEFGQPSYFWIFQQVLHPILLHHVILPVYGLLNLGKAALVLSQWLNILSKAVSWQEKRGVKPKYFPKALPNALAQMADYQLAKLEQFNAHRKQMADFYYETLKNTSFVLPERDNSIFLRFTMRHPKAHEIIYDAWHEENILLGDWYTTPIAPDDTQLEEMRYAAGSCPNAELLSRETLNLPTHINISMESAKRIIEFLTSWK